MYSGDELDDYGQDYTDAIDFLASEVDNAIVAFNQAKSLLKRLDYQAGRLHLEMVAFEDIDKVANASVTMMALANKVQAALHD